LIESTVGGAVRRAGYNAFVQMLASSLAESGRESISGPISRLFSSQQQQQQLLVLRLQNLHQKVLEGPVIQQTIDEYNQLREDIAAMKDQKRLDMTAIGTAMNIISFVIKARSSTTVAFHGSIDAMSTMALKFVADTEAVSIKSLFEKKFESPTTPKKSQYKSDPYSDYTSMLAREIRDPSFRMEKSYNAPIVRTTELNEDINVASELVKTIISQVVKNRAKLADYHKNTLKNKYGFKFYKPQPARFYTKKTSNAISPFNLGIFLGGIVPDTVKNWLATCNDQGFELSTEGSNKRSIMFRKIRSMALQLFSSKDSKIQEGRRMIELAISNYMNKYYSEPDYITKICFLLDDCAIWENIKGSKVEPHSKESISLVLEQSHSYLESLALSSSTEQSIEVYSKYFKLATNLLLIKQTDFKFISDKEYRNFREGTIDIIFEELVRLGIFEEELRPQFDAIVHTLYALTVARFNQYKDNPIGLKQFIKRNNPKALYTLDELSREVSQFGRRQSLSENIKYKTFMSPDRVTRIKSLLDSAKSFAPSESRLAQSLIDEIPRQRTKNRASYVGLTSHPVLEEFFRKVLSLLGIRSEHEVLFNRPDTYHRIDTSIDILSQRSKLDSILNRDIMKKLGITIDDLKSFFIDYTIPSLAKIDKVIKKSMKFYQAKDRLLFVVFYGQYNKDIFDVAQRKLQSSNARYKENIRFISITDFASIFNLKPSDITNLKNIDKLITKALRQTAGALEELETLSNEAMDSLEKNRHTFLG
jgi:hypothetical protein